MSPFDQNIDYDAGHALDPSIDQDDLIAFHLHELSPPQERALHRVLQTNPALQSESVAIATALHAFPKNEAALPLNAAALDRHWQALRSSLTPHIPQTAASRSLFQFQRWILPTLAGSGLATTALLVALHHGRQTNPITSTLVATTQSPTSAAPSSATHPEASQPNPPTNSQSNPVNSLPLTPHRAWLLSSAPIETAAAAPPIFLAQAPTSLTPTGPSTPAATTTSKAATPPPTSNPAQTQPPAESTTPSTIRPGRSPRASAPHRPSTTELTLGGFGNLTDSSRTTYTLGTGTSAITQSISQTATPSLGALGSLRQQFGPWLGYRVTATYTSPSFESTGQNIYEFAGTYVVQGPHHGHLTTSAEAGAGLLDILTNPNFPAIKNRTFRPSAIVGVGSELTLTRHWGLRAEVRAQLYKSPLLNSNSFVNGSSTSSGTLTFNIDPIIGVTYRFGSRNDD